MDMSLLRQTYGEKISLRINEINKALSLFKEAHEQHTGQAISFVEGTAEKITYLYFHWHYSFIKPFISDKANRFKVASGTELAICYLQPFYVDNNSAADCRPINAEFACFCALNFILGFKPDDDEFHISDKNWLKFDCGIERLKDKMDEIIRNHKFFLTHFDKTNTPPIIANASFWEVLILMHEYKFQALLT